jgi:monofunctional biosynthetic peptidoglycan transglycosylase
VRDAATRRRRARAGGTARRVLLAAALAGVAVVGHQIWTWPDVAALARQRPTTTAFIERYREDQRARGRSDRVDWRWVPAGAIAPSLKRAVVVAEDANFFSHRGFDFREIEQAMREAVEEGEAPRGASTITQQLAKNLWLSPSRNPYRKLKEAILTWQLERRLDKRRILEIYLNVVELGPGVFGAEAASRRYFGKTAAALDEVEAAQLAASLPNPAAGHPGVTSRAYQRRVATILRRMERAGHLPRWLGRGAPPPGGRPQDRRERLERT